MRHLQESPLTCTKVFHLLSFACFGLVRNKRLWKVKHRYIEGLSPGVLPLIENAKPADGWAA